MAYNNYTNASNACRRFHDGNKAMKKERDDVISNRRGITAEQRSELYRQNTEAFNQNERRDNGSVEFPFVIEILLCEQKIIETKGRRVGSRIIEEFERICQESTITLRKINRIDEYKAILTDLDPYFDNTLLCQGLAPAYTKQYKSDHDFIILLRSHLINIKRDRPSVTLPQINPSDSTGVIVGMLAGSVLYEFKKNPRIYNKRVKGEFNTNYKSLLYIELLCGGTCVSRTGAFLINTLKYIGVQLLKVPSIKEVLLESNRQVYYLANGFNGHGIALASVENPVTLDFYKGRGRDFLPMDKNTSEIRRLNDDNLPFYDPVNAGILELSKDNDLYLLYSSLDHIAADDHVVERLKPKLHYDHTHFTYWYSFWDRMIRNGYHGKEMIEMKLLEHLQKYNNIPDFIKRQYASFFGKHNKKSNQKRSRRNKRKNNKIKKSQKNRKMNH
jgi:hypothetical protein